MESMRRSVICYDPQGRNSSANHTRTACYSHALQGSKGEQATITPDLEMTETLRKQVRQASKDDYWPRWRRIYFVFHCPPLLDYLASLQLLLCQFSKSRRAIEALDISVLDVLRMPIPLKTGGAVWLHGT